MYSYYLPKSWYSFCHPLSVEDWYMSRKSISQRIVRLKSSLSDHEAQLRQHMSAVSYFESLAGRQADTSIDDDACIICFEPMTRLTVTPCGHLFCNACIASCLAANGLCPTCRRSVKLDELVEIKVTKYSWTTGNVCRGCHSASVIEARSFPASRYEINEYWHQGADVDGVHYPCHQLVDQERMWLHRVSKKTSHLWLAITLMHLNGFRYFFWQKCYR